MSDEFNREQVEGATALARQQAEREVSEEMKKELGDQLVRLSEKLCELSDPAGMPAHLVSLLAQRRRAVTDEVEPAPIHLSTRPSVDEPNADTGITFVEQPLTR